MSDSFNGYHVWLGIPPGEQPPNHYRLLGITAFETDLDVIDHAADRQMAHVRTFQSGKHGALSQRILNELASARICLLHADRKAEYDQGLRAKLPAAPQMAVPVGKAVPMAAPVSPAAAPRMPANAQPVAAARTPVAAQPAPATAPRTPSRAQPAPVAKPLEDDAYDVDSAALAPMAERVEDDEDYSVSDSLVSAGKTIKISRRRSFGRDDSLQRTMMYILVAVAAVVVLMVGYGVFRRATADVKWRELFTMPQGAIEAPHDPAADAHKPQAPPPPTPGSHTDS